jgi:hypothetical protein
LYFVQGLRVFWSYRDRKLSVSFIAFFVRRYFRFGACGGLRNLACVSALGGGDSTGSILLLSWVRCVF